MGLFARKKNAKRVVRSTRKTKVRGKNKSRFFGLNQAPSKRKAQRSKR